ncbi:DNA mismatch repair endonuclease MutL [Ammonifex thiophilus]|uniref:DNA mismatch repair protein MutL n=1 Tax=Ammonifex thiophilus TaxID=444093 RepID=A0A3D8P7U2_9THEO|nr:DNA mismatch repair endonuclease MutL [Ammonifex thiophilus]RDV84767.1 DNA mismatch repair endonuclease MutL [Ammonifex thiophilus]
MGKIKVLDPDTVSLVAAGEVVERPASVVKELVENALDAQARRITVRVEKDFGPITVVDNGCGIPADEVLLAFSRHATSKISTARDLENITTLGFRGEALPSIAAVSRLTMKTREPGAEEGMLVEIAGGEVLRKETVGAPPGTQVIVRDLFYNVPARRKFLSSWRAESSHIVDLLEHLALAWPEVSFSFWLAGREVFHTPGTGLLPAITAIYGAEVASTLLPLEAEEGELKIRGFLGRPELARGHRRHQVVVVNRRLVRHYGIAQAIAEAFGSLLPAGKHPFFVLFLELPPRLVDVNVHPQKTVVRFADEREVLALCREAVKRALFGERRPMVKTPPSPPPRSWDEALRELRFSVKEVASMAERVAESPPTYLFSFLPPLTYLGFLPPVYILAQGPEGLYVVDQHAAHERILFEKYAKAAENQGVPSQGLLEPIPVSLKGREWEEIGPYIMRFGFVLEPFGRGTALLRAIPADLEVAAACLLLEEFLTSWEEIPVPRREREVLALMACHGAVRAGEVLSPPLAQELLNQLAACHEPTVCPHGRPTFFSLSYQELEKRLGRR